MSTYDILLYKDISKTETKYNLDYSYQNYKYIWIRVDHSNFIKASAKYKMGWLGQIVIPIYSSSIPYYITVKFIEATAVLASVAVAVSGTAEFSGTAKLVIYGINA